MGGKTRRAEATQERRLRPEVMACRECGQRLRLEYSSWRKVATRAGLVRLKLSIRRCANPACTRDRVSTHPLEEGHVALPHDGYGLDVLAFIGQQRDREQATTAQIHAAREPRRVRIRQRNVQYLLERDDELVALSARDSPERRARLTAQGRLILTIDGLQPDVGHEVLWVIREVLSGEVRLARSLLSSRPAELIALLREAVARLNAPVVGVISDGQQSIGKAVATALPGVPHQLCQFHYWKQAVGPAWEADRHAKKALKKRVRAMRPPERAVSEREDAEAKRRWCESTAPPCAGRSAMRAMRPWSRAGGACISAWGRYRSGTSYRI